MLTSPMKLLRCWYPARINSYALPEKVLTCADIILNSSTDAERRMLLDLTQRRGESELSSIRQYTPDIELCVGIRDNQVKYMTEIIPGENMSVADFVIDSSNSEDEIDENSLYNELLYLKADYVFAPDHIISENGFMEKCCRMERTILFGTL